jgi:hypothetical protein
MSGFCRLIWVLDIMAARYTEDGHLLGSNGWIVPLNAHEFYERYRDKVRMFAQMLSRHSREDWDEIEQRTWLKLFRHPGAMSFYPYATDYINYLNCAFATHPDDSRINLGSMLAYIKTIVRSAAITDAACKESGALERRGNVSLSDCEYESEDGANDSSIEEWAQAERNTFNDPMFNDPDRVLFLQEFITYVEEHAPHLMTFLLSIEDAKLFNKMRSDPVYRAKKTELLALAEKFEGKTPTGRTDWYITKDYIKFNNKPPRTTSQNQQSLGEKFFRILNPLRERPLSVKEIAANIGIQQNRISSEGTILRDKGLVERTGEIRDGAFVLRLTALGMETHTVDDLVLHGVKKRRATKLSCPECQKLFASSHCLNNHKCRRKTIKKRQQRKEPKQQIVLAPKRGHRKGLFLDVYNCVAERPDGLSSLDVAVKCGITRDSACVILNELKKRGHISSVGIRYQTFKPTDTPFVYRRGRKKRLCKSVSAA